MPQPGYFASALRGQALQYAANATSSASLPMPGPGFFSAASPGALPTTAATANQSTPKTAAEGVGSKTVASTSQPIPVIGAAASKFL